MKNEHACPCCGAQRWRLWIVSNGEAFCNQTTTSEERSVFQLKPGPLRDNYYVDECVACKTTVASK